MKPSKVQVVKSWVHLADNWTEEEKQEMLNYLLDHKKSPGNCKFFKITVLDGNSGKSYRDCKVLGLVEIEDCPCHGFRRKETEK